MTAQERQEIIDEAMSQIIRDDPTWSDPIRIKEREEASQALLSGDPNAIASFHEGVKRSLEELEAKEWAEAIKDVKAQIEAEKSEILRKVKEEREKPRYPDGRPKPKNIFDIAWLEYFWQRGATIKYTSVEGEHIAWNLKSWKYADEDSK